MNYRFPENLSVEEVREAVEAHNARLGAKAFLEVDKGAYRVFNYVISMEGSFPHPSTGDAALDRQYAILRECRGLTFHADGRLAARKFQKFFNVNEKPETQQALVDIGRPHHILEKMDGSLITPVLFPGEAEPHWHTKMGATDVAKPVAAHVASRPDYAVFARGQIEAGFTPMFEWCSRQQRIVIDYPEDRLVLTAIRDNRTGGYVPYETMLEWTNFYDIPVVRMLPGSIGSMATFLERSRGLLGQEGWIIRFEDGGMVKVKAEDYVLKHRSKDAILKEKFVWSLVVDDKIDDVLPFLVETDRDALLSFVDAFNRRLAERGERYAETVAAQRRIYGDDKKAFAGGFMAGVSGYDKPILFSVWDGRDPVAALKVILAKNLGTQSRVDAIRPLLGDDIAWGRFFNVNQDLDG